ncbi:MAG: TonB-dependent receptor [Kaiparowitsia implicata GSE-PSE-MK54-09C]|jgi:iron complex outermembrane receptor protein|nr:TonB-dependent receptor [Kaiparowitsia implicata GSE-PSE-MK54-09C]
MANFRCLVWLAGVMAVLATTNNLPALAQDDDSGEQETEAALPSKTLVGANPQALSDFTVPPAITVDEWLTQIAQSELVQVTGVEIDTTEDGLTVNLQATGTLAQPRVATVGNALIVEISNAVLALPQGQEFQQADPAAGIALLAVTALPNNQVRVAITGLDAPPTADIQTDGQSLILSVLPGVGTDTAENEEAIQVVVTGEQEGYAPSNATTATRTDTPLRDIPQSIQVIPRQVLEDQAATDLQDITRNVSGVFQSNTFGGTLDRFQIRGFDSDVFLQDGFRDPTFRIRETANIERVEILKGPASVLYGTLEPGGIINIVTKQPLAEPYYSLAASFGSFGLIEPSIDISGPLSEDGEVLYRLNTLYENRDVFRDFDQDVERFFIAPVISLEVDERTDLLLNFEYLNDERPFDRGLVAVGNGVANIPFDRILGEPDDFAFTESTIASYRLEHRFSENWQLRNEFRYSALNSRSTNARPVSLDEDTGILSRAWGNNSGFDKTFALQTNVVGEFSTGSIDHTLLLGIDLLRIGESADNRFDFISGAPSINIFAPEYGVGVRPGRDQLPEFAVFSTLTDSLGIYVQDQIAIADNLRILIGGRFDILSQESSSNFFFSEFASEDQSQQQNEAFSPRLGILYRPLDFLSLYASYSRSFAPNSAVDEGGQLLEPERGTQFEAGIRGDFFDGRLTANLAAFDLRKTNISSFVPPTFSFAEAIGEVRSRGIELDVLGEITEGWNIIASYSYIDAKVTEDSGSELEGNRPHAVPEHALSLWTTYEIPQGSLQGLGFGLGAFLVGNRFGDDANTFEVGSYTRVDASVFYRRNNWQAAVNFKNLFDIDYIEGPANDRTQINPGIPFTVQATVSVEF